MEERIMSKTEVQINELKINLTPGIERVLEKIGADCAEALKQASPKGNSGIYSRGWTYDMESKETVVVHNVGRQKSLTHLLELGHMTRPSVKGFGKKAQRFVPPNEHIRPVYNKFKRQYLEQLKKIDLSP